jgi:hypothetical protein
MDNGDIAHRRTIYDFGIGHYVRNNLNRLQETGETSNSHDNNTSTNPEAPSRSRTDRLQSTPVSKSQDPFKTYMNSGIRVLHGSPAWLVSNNTSGRGLYVIKTIHSDQEHSYLQSMKQVVSLARGAFPEFIEAFNWHANFYVVFEHIEITAAQIAMSRMHANEKQLACMAYQVSSPADLSATL